MGAKSVWCDPLKPEIELPWVEQSICLCTGYGEIHAVNLREMIFIMFYVSFDMILGAYLIGNMTALIVKGSKTERYRDKMTDLIKYMNRNRLGRDVRNQIKGHLRLQYESSYTEAAVLQDIPISIRAKVKKKKRDAYNLL
ncbi:unnamed protein product [Ilex paraguariensis]|uniref:Uncharacterized protein n=1 Tax=Ilex paraguariensis TaxID=185542 RepID=A0ABC8TVR9_9AQUA